MPKPKLYLLDAMALLHRAWHAVPPLTNAEGTVVNAVYGVLSIVMKLRAEHEHERMIACWDTAAPTFRHEAYTEYKAHREEQPDELYAQIPLLEEGLHDLGIESVSLDGYEADDVIGTLAMQAVARGYDVVIVSGDKDLFQLLRPGISVLTFKKGVTETALVDELALKTEYGLTPEQFLEYKIMRGDPSDNIPGIKGIGEKGATTLLQTYGTLERVMVAAHDPASDLSASVRQKLLEGEPALDHTRKLVTILTDVPLPFDLARPPLVMDETSLRAFLSRMGFTSLLRRLGVEAVPTMRPAKRMATERVDEADHVRRVTCFEDLVSALSVFSSDEEIAFSVDVRAQASLFGSGIVALAFVSKCEALVIDGEALHDARVAADIQTFLSTAKFCGHDVKQEMHWLASVGLSISHIEFDTMLAAYLLAAGERNHDLSILALSYLKQSIPVDASALVRAQTIYALTNTLRKTLQQEHGISVLERFELPLIPVLFDMEVNGIKLDVGFLKTLAQEFRVRAKEHEATIIKLAGKDVNPASPSQLAEVLFTTLALPVKGIKKGKTGYSTAAQELEKLRGSHPIIEEIENFREVSKLLSTYVEPLPLQIDGSSRVHTTFQQAVAATGRLSSINPNLQNIPIRTELGRRIRRAFVSAPGYRLLACDYSQIELRVAAALAKDEVMLETFRRGEDVHVATAAKIWNIPLSNVSKDQRRAAKTINFGVLYGQGAHALALGAGITFTEAKQFITEYFRVYRGIQDYLERTKAMAHSLGYVETLFGRRRLLPEIHSMLPQVRAQAERMAINMPVQGTAADIMKLAMIQAKRDLPTISLGARMVLQVHDELLLEVPETDVVRVAEYMKSVMEHIEDVGVPLLVEPKVGQNWDDLVSL